MRTKKIILILIILQNFMVFSQDKDIPFLLWNCSGNNKIILFTDKFKEFYTDSLRVRFKVSVFMEHPLNDKMKPIIIKHVELNNISVKKDNNNDVYNISCKETNELKKELWTYADSIVSHWYKNQNYEILSDHERSNWNNQIVMTGGFYIVKKK